jgi:hypothetical protein
LDDTWPDNPDVLYRRRIAAWASFREFSKTVAPVRG